MTDVDPQPAPVVKVAQDLTAITHLAEHLLTQAVHSANDHELPGGDAMVALAPVADPGAYRENIEAAEYRHEANPRRWGESTLDMVHEDDDMAPVLQVLWYWSDAWRTERGYPLEGRRATVTSEATFIRLSLDWIWDNELHWDDFARDVRGARRRLENLLRDGERAEHGVMCPSCEAPGRRLVLHWDDRDATGANDEYRCPADYQHRWTVGEYRKWVADDYLAHADSLTADQIHQQWRIKPGTLRQWVNRGVVRRRGRDHSGRQLYDVAQAIAVRDGMEREDTLGTVLA